MDTAAFTAIETYMIECMKDGAHDTGHIYRVLDYALDISEQYTVDLDVLAAAALLHDIGRGAQFRDPSLDHAAVGSVMAYTFLTGSGWKADKAEHVKKCISTHRDRKNSQPESMEAKILFDADKLDATGAVGIARTLAYIGIVGEPLYTVGSDGEILDGTGEDAPSFFQEYHFKLKHICDGFYTERAKEIAAGRNETAQRFYAAMLQEVTEQHRTGRRILASALSDRHETTREQ